MAYISGKNNQHKQSIPETNPIHNKADELRHQLFEGRKRVNDYCQWLQKIDDFLADNKNGFDVVIPEYPESLDNVNKPLAGKQLLNKAARQHYLKNTCPSFQLLNTDQLVDMTDLSEVF